MVLWEIARSANSLFSQRESSGLFLHDINKGSISGSRLLAPALTCASLLNTPSQLGRLERTLLGSLPRLNSWEGTPEVCDWPVWSEVGEDEAEDRCLLISWRQVTSISAKTQARIWDMHKHCLCPWRKASAEKDRLESMEQGRVEECRACWLCSRWLGDLWVICSG
jgi:hypothetical protein